ncbi:MAG: hypothetical protein HY762_08965 [Planctomycetes bacterium]|nr:hypothetical protein [Planctomycetota bacterium]
MIKSIYPLFTLVAVFLLVGTTAYACEPMFGLGIALGGPAMWSAFTISLYGLIIAIAVKCLSFPFLVKDLHWFKAIIFMIVANIVSSIIGALLGASAVVAGLMIVFIPIVYLLSLGVGERIKLSVWRPLTRFSKHTFASIITGLWFGSFFLFTGGIISADFHSYAGYWLFKILYVFVALLISFRLTTLWEEWVISALARQREKSYLRPVAIANLITFMVVALIGAIIMIPQRLDKPGFLILSLIDKIVSTFLA